jgi:hypothetical protein
MRRRWQAIFLLATACGGARATTPPDPAALLAALQHPAPTQTEFFERRQSPLLAQPLLFSGELQRPQSGTLVKRIEHPYVEHTRIEGEKVTVEREGERARRFSLRRAPELRALTASVEAVLAGDIALLQKFYTLRMEGSEAAWTLHLAPLDKRLAKRVESMRFLGTDTTLRCMDLVLAGDETSRTWLGDAAAPAAQAADEAARDALCGSAP